MSITINGFGFAPSVPELQGATTATLASGGTSLSASLSSVSDSSATATFTIPTSAPAGMYNLSINEDGADEQFFPAGSSLNHHLAGKRGQQEIVFVHHRLRTFELRQVCRQRNGDSEPAARSGVP